MELVKIPFLAHCMWHGYDIHFTNPRSAISEEYDLTFIAITVVRLGQQYFEQL